MSRLRSPRATVVPLALLAILARTTHAQLPASAPVIIGEVRAADGKPVAGAEIAIRLFSVAGERTDVVWTVTHVSDGAGQFAFVGTDFPLTDLAPRSYAGTLTVDANNFQGASADLVLHRDTAGVSATPQRLSLRLKHLDRALYYNLMLPALVGFVLAILSLTTTQIRLSFFGRRLRYRYWQYHPAIYALAVVGLWINAVIQLVQAYIGSGQDMIPVGPGAFGIPSALIVTTYLGSLTYVAYSVFQRRAEFFEPEFDVPRNELLKVIAGRVLVAPYVAAVAYGILATTFSALETPPFIIFFGFFTGLWIKAVLDALNAVGKKLLSAEAVAKLEARVTSTERVERAPAAAKLLTRGDDRVELRTDHGTLSLPVDRTRIALSLRTPGTVSQVETELGVTASAKTFEGFTVFATNRATVDDYRRLVEAARASRLVLGVRTVFSASGSTDRLSFASDRVTMALKTAANDLPRAVQRVVTVAGGTATSVAEKEYAIKLQDGDDPFAIAASLNAIPEVAFAEPDFIQFGAASGTFKPQPCPGSADAPDLAFTLLNVPAAWKLADAKTPHPVRIAILDDGVDETPADLTGAPRDKPFDAFAGEYPYPQPHDIHGTQCAGLVLAVPATAGMRGIASGATLLAVRVNLTTSSGLLVTSSGRIRRGIEEAVARGADVLSLSWSTDESLAVRLAVESAATSGRKGKGCVVVAAAGNDGGAVAFPAKLAPVIAVAGTDGQRAVMRSSKWSSNFGPEIDIAAPGTQTFTVTRKGAKACIDGTSAATAMVAGAAALCLRLNPALTGKQVRDLLIATSDVLPAGPAHPNAKIQFLDVEAAVKAV